MGQAVDAALGSSGYNEVPMTCRQLSVNAGTLPGASGQTRHLAASFDPDGVKGHTSNQNCMLLLSLMSGCTLICSTDKTHRLLGQPGYALDTP